jgi:hypothetical protein
VRVFARDWVDCFAAVMLSLTSMFSYVHEAYGTAVVSALCAGLVGGMVFTRWAIRRR